MGMSYDDEMMARERMKEHLLEAERARLVWAARLSREERPPMLAMPLARLAMWLKAKASINTAEPAPIPAQIPIET